MRITLILLLVIGYSIVYSQEENATKGNGTIQYLSLFNKTSKSGVSCYRIPALVTAPNGDLITAIDERVPSCGDLRMNNDINIVIRRSQDNGKTWSDTEPIVDYPYGQSASDPSMIVDKTTDEVFLFFNYMDLNKGKDTYYLKFVCSKDNGKTWNAPKDITSQITKSNWQHDFKFITSGRGIMTTSGKLLHTVVNLDKGLFVFGSDDHGKTWFLINTPIKPADESQIVELADGAWMINSRVNGSGIRYKHISSDEGKTWSTKPDSSLFDPGCNASILRYTSVKEGSDKNRLLFSNANTNDARKNMTVKVSYDEGESWSEQKTIYSGDAAYSSMSVLQNGDLVLFFEKDNYQDNVFVRFTLDWLTDGRDKNIKFKK